MNIPMTTLMTTLTRIPMRTFVQLVAAGLLCTVAAAHAQPYPSRSVRVVNPYQAGGGLDMMCRTIAEQMGKSTSQPFVVENRTGAGGTIGAATVAQAPPDGYTILCANNSEITLAQVMMAKLPYDPEADLAPLAMAVRQTVVLFAHPAVPAANVKQLIDLTRKQTLSYANSGNNTNLYLAMEMFAIEAKAPFTSVPYKGAAGLVTDVLAGHVPVGVINLAPLVQHLASGKLRALMVFQPERNPAIPEVPAAREVVGVDVIAASWFGFFAPAKTPAPIRARLDQEIRRALAEPAVKARLAQAEMQIVALPSAEFGEAIKRERALHGELVKRFNIKPE